MRRHHGRDLDRVERQRRAHQADLPARQELRRRRHGGEERHRLDQGHQGQAGGGLRAGYVALFRALMDAEEERPLREGRDRRQHGAGPGRPGLHRRAERCGDDLRALSLLRSCRAAIRQDHRHHARLPDGDGHLRLHAEIPRRQSEGREGFRRQLFRGARDDRQGSGQGLRDHGRGREADRRGLRQVGPVPALAGPRGQQEVLRRRVQDLLGGSGRPACSKPASSSRSRTWNALADTSFIQ